MSNSAQAEHSDAAGADPPSGILQSISSGTPGTPALPPVTASAHTLEKVRLAKFMLENYFANLISQHKERERRLAILEQQMTVCSTPTMQLSHFFSYST